MQVLKIFAIRDRAIAAYAQPMFLQTTEQAIRLFKDEVNRPATDNPLYQHPEDFELFQLGEYDTNTAQFTNETPRQVAIGSQLAHGPKQIDREQTARHNTLLKHDY